VTVELGTMDRIKKDRTILVRIERDVETFLQEKAARRRVSVSQVVRDALYKLMEEDSSSENHEPNGEVKSHGVL
jgi:hypothetical protein